MKLANTKASLWYSEGVRSEDLYLKENCESLRELSAAWKKVASPDALMRVVKMNNPHGLLNQLLLTLRLWVVYWKERRQDLGEEITNTIA